MPLSLLHRTAPLADGDLFHHRQHILTRHLPVIDTSLKRVQISLIATHIREVTVKIQQEREAKVYLKKVDKEKGIPEIIGINLTYLLRLGQVSKHEDPTPSSGKSLQDSQSANT